jgi:PAS domain S-box-containing protein
MHDTRKTKTQLIDELESLRRRVAELQASQAAERKPTRQETEEATLTVIEAMADPLILFGMDGRFLFVNRAMETMSGFERNELIGKHFDEVLQEVTTEEELEEVRGTLRKGIEKGITPPFEFTWVTRDGSKLRVSTTASPIKDDRGKPWGLVATYRDMTDQKRIEKTLRESEERFRALFEGCLDAICLVDPVSGRILNANPVSSELLSKPLEDIIGMHYSEFHPPAIRERAHESFKAHVENTGPQQPIETALLTADGKEVPAELLAQMIQVDGVPVLLGTFRNITQRRKTEEALRHSEERYRLLVQNASDIAALFDEDGTIRYVSPAVERILGYRPEELIGQPGTAVLHPEDQRTMRTDLERWLKSPDGSTTGQYRYRHKDGSWRTLESVASDCLEHPAVRAIVVNSRDVTERKRLEKELLKSEELYRLVAQNSPDIITIINPDNSFRYISPAAERILGYSPEETIEHMGFDHVHPEDRAPTVAAYTRLMEKPDELLNCRYRLRRKDGSYRFVEALGRNLLANPAVRAIALNVRDITERRQLEEQLRSSEERYRLLDQNSSDMIVLMDQDSTVHYVSPTAERILGYKPEELLGQTGLDFHHPEDRPGMLDAMNRCFQNPDEPVLAQYRFRHKDGSWRWLESIANNCLDHPSIRAIVVNTRDITERKKMEETLEKSEQLESLGILCGGIAHDFNNILTAVLTNISMARMYGELEEDIEKMLADAEKASLRGKGLTQQLLTFAKGGEPIKSAVSIATLLKDTIDFTLSGSNVRCEHDLPENLWPVDADEGQIGQVIQNVILNADQAMPGGGVIQVRAENVTITEHDPLPLKPGSHVKVTIVDQGIGIPEEHLQKVFDPFFTTKQKGSGLGLSASFSIVKRHNGALQVESRLGGGTKIHVYLPALPEDGASRDARRDASYRGEERILLVDDDETLRRSIGKALDRLGYQVECAEDGKEGIRIYEEARASGRPIQVVVLDLTIPDGMGGKDAARELLRIDPDAKLIVSSGYSTDPVMSDFRAHGFRAVISKPYRIEELGETLRKVLNVEQTQGSGSGGRESGPASPRREGGS